MMKRVITIISLFLLHFNFALSVLYAESDINEKLTDEKMMAMLDIALSKLPEKVTIFPENIRRVAFYALRADRSQVSQILLRQIQGKIESAFCSLGKVHLVFAPEVKPIKIIAKDESIIFSSGFQTSDEIRNIAQKLRIDGFLEGEIYYTTKYVFLNLRIFDAETLNILWSAELTNEIPISPPEPPQKIMWYDVGLGGAAMPAERLLDNTFHRAIFYTADFRTLIQTHFDERIKFSISGGILYLYEGISSSTMTIVTSNKRAVGPPSYVFRIGLRYALLRKESKIRNVGIRDLLSTEFSVGNIFAAGKERINILNFLLRFELDITKDISITAGLSYIPLTQISEADIRVGGGFMYEICIIRLLLNP